MTCKFLDKIQIKLIETMSCLIKFLFQFAGGKSPLFPMWRSGSCF